MLRTLCLCLASLTLAALGQIPDDIAALIEAGEYTEARAELADQASRVDDPALARTLIDEAERLRRVQMDFRMTAEDVIAELQRTVPDARLDELETWREAGLIQALVIDGEWRYFRRGPRNLLRQASIAARRANRVDAPEVDPAEAWDFEKMNAATRRRQHIATVIEAAVNDDDGYVLPQRRRVTYTLAVDPGAVPEGETIRAWLPMARPEPHIADIELLWTVPGEHILAPEDAGQRTVYMEMPAPPADESAEFRVCFEYTAWAFHRHIDPETVLPHDPDSDLFQRYTAEEPPHVVFTPEILALVEAICGDEPNPYLRARAIYEWMHSDIRYISEREYSTILNISDLCRTRGGGDCGVQAILLITLLRAAGVPARWESGWWMQPGTVNMHDWARFHIEPHGWLFADPSHSGWFGESDDSRFYFGSVDHYRLVVNSAYSQPLTPAKEHMRSETVDFQRGEVEWDGGNLYFDQWSYRMEPEEL